ncbi:MAG: membrane-bound lytic murein transglycosylase MltF [Proteobacteria bacterium]|nr:membrane-bound lytic murein transglycosylase MltF [Pseudomonadota bacterium]
MLTLILSAVIPAKKRQQYLAPLLCLLAALFLPGCAREDSLDHILSSGELKVVSRNGPTTYYQDKNGPTGFEYALATLLAEELGVGLKIEPAFKLEAIFEILQREEADLAAAGLTLTGQREASYPHSVPYYQLKPQVIYKAGSFRPRSIKDLQGMTMLVIAGSSHANSLLALQQGGAQQLQWEEVEGADSMELLESINSGYAQLTILDSNEFEVQQALYPRLKVAFDLGQEQQLAWFLPPGRDNTRLLEHIDGFFARLDKDGTMERLREIHFGHTAGVTRMGSHTFTRNMRKTLPDYQTLIQQVAEEYQMDWHLLAAISYQESHWNPLATSPTGVRGLMMLTLPTAREMGVENRLDPLQSLRGGARYLKNIKRRLPQRIEEPDLTWFSLAAYNIGMGHLEDARVITQRQGRNPDMWVDVMAHLPFLQKSKYYEKARYGYARGSEPVTYVQNIRHYYSILQWQDITHNKPLPPVKPDDYLPASVRDKRFSAL